MTIQIGEQAPNLSVQDWVQGTPTNLDQERGNVVLVEVFQVNCPGCFMHGIPQAIDIHEKYRDRGVTVLGLATAFEDFDKNTLANLKMLAETGEVVGDTLRSLGQQGQLDGNRITFKIPYPLGMDSLVKTAGEVTDEQSLTFIRSQVPDFDSQPEAHKAQVIKQVGDYLRSKEYSAGTFEQYALRGTPSTILVDREGVLRDVSFGHNPGLESAIRALLDD